MRRRSKAAGFFLMVGVTAGAQQASLQQANLPEWPRVRVNVSIIDRNGAPAVGVDADAVEVRDDKTLVKDAVLRPAGNAPESVCLLVDTSGSTYQARGVIDAEVDELINKLPAADELCLVDFATSAYVDAPLTMDRGLVRKGLSYLKSSGGSAMLDAMEATSRYMEKNAHFEQRVIVLVSDGGDNASKHNAAQVWDVLHWPEAPVVYSIANRSEGRTETADWESMVNLSERTGGLAFPVERANEAVPAADHLIEAVRGRYELEFTASDAAPDGKKRKLRVAADEDLRTQKMKVVGPDGYVAARQ